MAASDAHPLNIIPKLNPMTDGATPDQAEENRRLLQQLFPEIFCEGQLDLEKLRETLGDYVDEKEERYDFSWAGKAQARRAAQTPSTGTLRPCREESKNWEQTQNLFLEGDNLEILKLLQKAYHRKVKMIYIDPPYNTGKEFIYPDNYQDTLKNYLELTGQSDDQGRKLSANAETSGRYHTNWLNLIYPRLRLARNLLRDDGFIVVSIDDAELRNLTKVLDELYGEENFLATLVWDRNRKNDAKFFSVGHEYMVVYAKDKALLVNNGTCLREPKEGIEAAQELYKNLLGKHGDDYNKIQEEWRAYFRKIKSNLPIKQLGRYGKINARGPYRDDGNISWPGGGGPKYEVLHPKTNKPCKVPDGGWRYSSPKRFWEEVESGKVVFGEDERTLPRQCRYLFEGEGQVMPTVFYSYAQLVAFDFQQLMVHRVFENPKNWKDISRIVNYLTAKDDIVLDFFSGSSTTAHAVMQQNAEDGGQRRFIMVQLPEPCDEKSEAFKAGYKTIAEIGKERIRRAGEKIVQESGDQEGVKSLDIGFKVLKLDSSNLKPWESRVTMESLDFFDYVENIKPDRSDEDLLYEVLLKYGLELTLPIEERLILKKRVFIVGDGMMVACLEKGLTLELVEAIGAMMEALRQAKPDILKAAEMRVVFRDDGFRDDVVKTNTLQILKRYGVENVRSL